MSNKIYRKESFLCKEGQAKDLWDSIMIILDENINIEQDIAISSEIELEKRIHQCGRAEALKSIKSLLIEERKSCFKDFEEEYTE